MDEACLENLKAILIAHEDRSQFAYEDSLGFITIGIGRCVDRRKGKGLSNKEQVYLLSNDIDECKNELEPFVWYQQLDDIRKCVMIELCFNMGIHGLLEFKRTLAAIKNKNFDLAIIELKDSKWSTQIGAERIKNICYRLKNGSYPKP